MKWTDVKKDISSISQEDKNLIELTALLASLRKEKKMTQKELADKVHVSQAQIARVENFSYAPSLTFQRRPLICQKMKIFIIKETVFMSLLIWWLK